MISSLAEAVREPVRMYNLPDNWSPTFCALDFSLLNKNDSPAFGSERISSSTWLLYSLLKKILLLGLGAIRLARLLADASDPPLLNRKSSTRSVMPFALKPAKTLSI